MIKSVSIFGKKQHGVILKKLNESFFFRIIKIDIDPIIKGIHAYEKMGNAVLFKISQNNFIQVLLLKGFFKESRIVKTYFPVTLITAVTQKNT